MVTGLSIPLAWEQGKIRETCAIEVYPAATLLAYGVPHLNYKKKSAIEDRKELYGILKTYLKFEVDKGQVIESSDSIDATICVLTGYDYLMKRCIPPRNRKIVQREGWIWVRRPIQ